MEANLLVPMAEEIQLRDELVVFDNAQLLPRYILRLARVADDENPQDESLPLGKKEKEKRKRKTGKEKREKKEKKGRKKKGETKTSKRTVKDKANGKEQKDARQKEKVETAAAVC